MAPPAMAGRLRDALPNIMPIDVKEFWKLAVHSQLLAGQDCRNLHEAFTRLPGAATRANVNTLAEWLVAGNVLSRYQANVLLSGRPGPFVFGEYKTFDRHTSGRLKGLYRAVHMPSGYPVLMVFVPKNIAQDPQLWPLVTRQAEAAIAATCDTLSRVFELVDNSANRFVVVEDLEGQTVGESYQGMRLNVADACRLVRSAALAAHALHQQSQVHADIRPANLWLGPIGDCKLLGFPLAREAWTSPALIVGDPAQAARLEAAADYLAPELARNKRPPDAVSDVYALGCTLYELLVGHPPFAGGALQQKLTRHATEPLAPLDHFLDVPPPVAQLLARMLAKNPPVRVQDAAAVADGLLPFATPEPERVDLPALAMFSESLASRRPAAPFTPAAFAGGSGPAHQRTALDPGPVVIAREAAATGAARSAPGAIVISDKLTQVKMPGAAGVQAIGQRPARKINANLLAVGGVGALVLVVIVAWMAMTPAASKKTSKDERVASATTESEPVESLRPKKKIRTRRPNLREPSESDTPSENQTPDDSEIQPKPARSVKPAPPKFELVDDDGHAMWGSPTAGPPLDLRYLPTGAILFLALRPAEILANSEGARMIEGLGPAADLAKRELEAFTGCRLSDMEQLIIAFYPNESGFPRAAAAVRLATPVSQDTLLQTWKDPTPAEHSEKKFYKGAVQGYYFPAEEKGKVFAIAPVAEMEDLVDRTEALLGKDMTKLVRESDAQRHFTLLMLPFAVFNDGKPLFVGELERIKDPFSRFLGDGIQALSLSCHAGESFFVEMRCNGSLDEDPTALAQRFHGRLSKLPAELNDYLGSLPLQPYGRKILLQFPVMIRLVAQFTRIGEEHKQALLRCYLPGSAGHNLVMATELTLSEQPGTAIASTKNPGPKKPAGPAEALKQKISLSFPRDTLEKTMDMLSKEIDTEIVLMGDDFRLEGITKNQSFGLDERDKPAGEILMTVLKLANTDGKLVYVIKPKEPGGKDILFITTRAAVAKRGDKLPPEMANVEPKKP